MEQKDPQAPWAKDLGLLGVISWNLVSYTLVGIGLGYLAWKKLGIPPFFTVVPALVGLFLGIFQVYRFVQKGQR